MEKIKIEELWTQYSINEDDMVCASLTDRYLVYPWKEIANLLMEQKDKILELRIFNPKREIKLFRSDISQEKFYGRELSDGTSDYYDEFQYLNIDTKRSVLSFSERQEVYPEGGIMVYHLPFCSMNDTMVQIRYYLSRYEKTGHARVNDWRIVQFLKGETK